VLFTFSLPITVDPHGSSFFGGRRAIKHEYSYMSFVILFPVIYLILPWLRMDCDLQLLQLRALSLDVLRACASRIAREAHVAISTRNKRTKATVSEFVVNLLRTFLRAIEKGTTLHSRRFSKLPGFVC